MKKFEKLNLTEDYLTAFENETWKPSPDQVKQLVFLARFSLKRINEMRSIKRKEENGVLEIDQEEYRKQSPDTKELLNKYAYIKVMRGERVMATVSMGGDLWAYEEYGEVEDLL